MIRKSILGGVLVLSLAAIGSQAEAGGRLNIPAHEFDFGITPQGAKISHIFWLHSNGDDTLKILKVNPG